MNRIFYRHSFFFGILFFGFSAPAEQPAENWLPFPGFAEGWQCPGKTQVYDKDNIFDLIDGEAERFFPYGFKQVAATTYTLSASSSRSLEAEVYRMGSKLDAFGIYSLFCYPEAEYLKIGLEGFRNSYQLMFFQDRFFTRLSAYGKPDQNKEDLLECAKTISKRLPESISWPKEIKKLLRIKNLIPHTIKYQAEELLGYSYFPRGIQAEAELEGNHIKFWIVFTESKEDAELAFMKYKDSLKASGNLILWKDQHRKAFFAGIPPQKGVRVESHHSKIFGVSEVYEKSEAVTELLYFIKN